MSNRAMKYRSSCDNCQDTKVKCSQAKPSCQRCSRLGLKCVYSPLRTIGRPKKRPISTPVRNDGVSGAGTVTEEQRYQSPVAIAAGSSVGLDRSLESAPPLPPMLSNHTSVSGYPSDTPEHVLVREVVDGSSTEANYSPDKSGIIGAHNAFLRDTPSSELMLSGDGVIHGAPYCANDPLGNFHQYAGFPITWPSENSVADDPDINYPWTSSNAVTEAAADHEYRRNDTRMSGTFSKHQSTITLDVMDPKADCYVILLSRLTQIENALATKPPEHPPPIDFTLGAENDLQNLKKRIFTCQSHGALDITRVGTYTLLPCLSSSRPVLIVLCLLAERVVHLFEELFQRANVLAQPFAETPQAACYPTTRRLKRTVRSLMDYSSTCPFPDANRPLHVGKFGVSDEVKTRALRRILRGRIQGLLDMLGDIKHATEPGRNDPLGSHVSGNIMGQEGSSAAASEAPGKIVGDLYLRVESLMGRLDLTG